MFHQHRTKLIVYTHLIQHMCEFNACHRSVRLSLSKLCVIYLIVSASSLSHCCVQLPSLLLLRSPWTFSLGLGFFEVRGAFCFGLLLAIKTSRMEIQGWNPQWYVDVQYSHTGRGAEACMIACLCPSASLLVGSGAVSGENEGKGPSPRLSRGVQSNLH